MSESSYSVLQYLQYYCYSFLNIWTTSVSWIINRAWIKFYFTSALNGRSFMRWHVLLIKMGNWIYLMWKFIGQNVRWKIHTHARVPNAHCVKLFRTRIDKVYNFVYPITHHLRNYFVVLQHGKCCFCGPQTCYTLSLKYILKDVSIFYIHWNKIDKPGPRSKIAWHSTRAVGPVSKVSDSESAFLVFDSRPGHSY